MYSNFIIILFSSIELGTLQQFINRIYFVVWTQALNGTVAKSNIETIAP